MQAHVYTLSYNGCDISYISLYQNHLFYEYVGYLKANGYDVGSITFGNSVFNSGFSKHIVQSLFEQTNKASLLIWDATQMSDSSTHVYEDDVYQLLDKGKYEALVIMNCSNKARDIAKEQLEKKTGFVGRCFGKTYTHIYISKDMRIMNDLKDLFTENFDNVIKEEKMRQLFEKTRAPEEVTPITSSNIYANRFFNIKTVFQDENVFSFVIFELTRKICQKYKGAYDEFDAFVCASVNGACLASAIATLIRKPVIFLRNVGPNAEVSDQRLADRILKGKKYIFIFDFICIGTEYHRIQMLCKMKMATIVYGVGVSHYKLPNIEKDKNCLIDTLFQINDYQSDYYHCGLFSTDIKLKGV